jgi:exosortase
MHDDNLTHGPFLPVLGCILVAESRRDFNPRFVAGGPVAFAGCVLFGLAAIVSVAVSAIYAAALGWNHGMAQFMGSVAVCFLLGSAWLAFADRRVRLVPVNWPAAVAVILWLFAGPPPSGSYARLALFLQGHVTASVVAILHAAGVAAFREGNMIDLASSSVGVSEACSGVRSLISCTVAGLFLSAVAVRRTRNRVVLVALSPFVGLAMNFVRSLILTLVANTGANIEGRWHDLTGESIIVFTTLILAAIALRLRAKERREPQPPRLPSPPMPGHSSLQDILSAYLGAILAGGIFVVVLATRSQPRPGEMPPLASLLPDAPAGWAAQTTEGLDQFSGVLRTHDLVERVYAPNGGQSETRLTLYVAYWKPGEASVTQVDAHTPDACWPGTGWESKPVPEERVDLSVDGRLLPTAERRLFAHDRFETNVWFWHLYGGHPLEFVDPYSALRLLKLSLRYGFRRPKDQLFVRISSNKPWDEVSESPVMRQFMGKMEPLGL